MAQEIEAVLRENEEFLARLQAQPAWVSFLAAAAGSVMSTLIMHPLDTLKTRLMASGGDSGSAEEGEEDEEGEGGSESGKKTSGLPSLAELPSLYAGVFANILKEAPASAIYLLIYEIVRIQLAQTSLGNQPLLVYLLAGSIGEIGGSLYRAPVDAVKIQIQTRGVGVLEALKSASTANGRASIGKAWRSSLWRDVPMGSVQVHFVDLKEQNLFD